MMFVVILLFLLFLVIGIPISLVLAITSLSYLLLSNMTTLMSSAPQKMFSGIDNFGLLAIPLFMLAGELMNGGGITTRLVSFAKVLIGHYRGGLAYVTVIANMFLASILGSANAQAAMMSKVMVPEMEKEGYRRDFSAAITLASSIVAPVIPPSMLFIIYGTLTGASIADLFMAGVIPGILLGVGFIIVIGFMNHKQQFPRSEKATFQMIVKSFLRVLPAMLIPFTIIFGILGGVFTPTESAAIACVIAFIIGLAYRELKLKSMPEILVNTVVNTATISFLIVTANLFGFIIAYEQIPQMVANSMLGLSENPLVFLLLVNIFLLLIGTVLDGIAALIILIPVMLPLLATYQIDPVHFGVIVCINLTIGLLTPPVGTGLFIVSSIAKVKFEDLIKAIMPFLAMAILVLLILTYWEDAALWIPSLYKD
ncbi:MULTISPECIES: TRAP transporter large permease [unclassified Sporosarcina]|uniref:TRAP transporter large permease n=1 Tax=unclassified Sporosarcina TaxID=2647733 RepID=UPI00203B7CE4|nr:MULTISPECIES: TRAP transporter large permease [unclassified Sporosarcina]GKV65240.1 C4-dicarboxylate ABC transporter permease [Sporosarcina sp. NCCP-2331]GLB55364.1 C4-dicarboxylate ABC transporter permease [Sporosarcina sp. NCCP-2378]